MHLEPFHNLRIFLINPFSLALFVDEVERSFLLEWLRAVDHGALAHVGLQHGGVGEDVGELGGPTHVAKGPPWLPTFE